MAINLFLLNSFLCSSVLISETGELLYLCTGFSLFLFSVCNTLGKKMYRRIRGVPMLNNQTEHPTFFSKKKKITFENLIANCFASTTRVFAFCLAFRIINSLLIQTYFNPDEHWQSLEVAHSIVFGYGKLTWEWKKGIRSYLHPLIFAFLYKLLALLGLDTLWIMAKAPRLMQAIFSSFGDLYLYKFSRSVFNKHIALWVMFSQLTNWFMFYCYSRTLSNSLEAVLTIIGLYYWNPFKESSNQKFRKWGLIFAALSCAIRPTSAIVWLYVGILDLMQTQERLKFLFLEVIPIGALVLTFTCLLDRWMYGSWVFVPLNFLKFNFLSSGGDYYGTHKWHWYLTQGFPVMLFTFLPFSLAGIFRSKEWKLFGLIIWVLAHYSLLGHKEFRFVLPVLPIALMFSGYFLATMGNITYDDEKKKRSDYRVRLFQKKKLAILFLVVSNVAMAIYMCLVHQRGSEDVMRFMAKEAHDRKVKSILFLMPCHSTPYYSTLHHNLPMQYLDCSPSEEQTTLDDSDRFMMDPVNFVEEMSANWTVPSHIILFDSQERFLQDFLTSHSFKEVKRFFHAHFKVDRDLQANVVVYALAGQ